ncbi:hypothetical protein ADUPG1_012978 [Aduncisulcus paluster]|uniref:Histone-binding protein RBBP4-like N-terminal domain-containing protein n=1 Tax=Aduncisulcus paluster TaxID=2918883 RepID=A0ABQ5K4J8_9EUKA|nr:hypothetical protein ADUPG1_012978 [Aduncisulcus paluster]
MKRRGSKPIAEPSKRHVSKKSDHKEEEELKYEGGTSDIQISGEKIDSFLEKEGVGVNMDVLDELDQELSDEKDIFSPANVSKIDSFGQKQSRSARRKRQKQRLAKKRQDKAKSHGISYEQYMRIIKEKKIALKELSHQISVPYQQCLSIFKEEVGEESTIGQDPMTKKEFDKLAQEDLEKDKFTTHTHHPKAPQHGEMERDSGAYTSFYRLNTDWSCLSCSFLPDHRVFVDEDAQDDSEKSEQEEISGDERSLASKYQQSVNYLMSQYRSTLFPHSFSFVLGTQAEKAKDNSIIICGVNNIQRTTDDMKEIDLDSEASMYIKTKKEKGRKGKKGKSLTASMGLEKELEEGENDDDAVVMSRYIHHHGCVNRLAVCPQAPWLVACISELGVIRVYDISNHLFHCGNKIKDVLKGDYGEGIREKVCESTPELIGALESTLLWGLDDKPKTSSHSRKSKRKSISEEESGDSEDEEEEEDSRSNPNLVYELSMMKDCEGYAIRWSRESFGRLVVGDCNGMIYVIDCVTWDRGSRIKAGQAGVNRQKEYFDHSRKARFVLSSVFNSGIVDQYGKPGSCEDVVFSPFSNDLFIGVGSGGCIALFDLSRKRDTALVVIPDAHEGDINVCDWGSNTFNGPITPLKSDSERKLRRERISRQFMSSEPQEVQDYVNSSCLLLTGGDDGLIKVWHIPSLLMTSSSSTSVSLTASLVFQSSFHTSPITSVAWSTSDVCLCISSEEGGNVFVWDITAEAEETDAVGDEEEDDMSTRQRRMKFMGRAGRSFEEEDEEKGFRGKGEDESGESEENPAQEEEELVEMGESLPVQLIFPHQGVPHPKECHFHPQIDCLCIVTHYEGVDLFKPIDEVVEEE